MAAMVPPSFAGLVLLAALPVRVDSDSTCPSEKEVAQALGSLLSSVAESRSKDVALVHRKGRLLQVDLRDAQGALMADKILERDGSCAELAALTAVVIASWESDVHPEFARQQPEPGPRPLPAPETIPPAAVSAYDVAVGGSLAWSGSLAGGMTAELGWIPRATGPGLRLAVAGEATRGLTLAQAKAHWQRLWSVAAIGWRIRQRPVTFDLLLGGVAGWLRMSGSGFAEDRASSAFSPGITAGARISWWVAGPFAPWLEVTGLWWPRHHTVYGEPAVGQRDIPAWQIGTALGVALGRAGQ